RRPRPRGRRRRPTTDGVRTNGSDPRVPSNKGLGWRGPPQGASDEVNFLRDSLQDHTRACLRQDAGPESVQWARVRPSTSQPAWRLESASPLIFQPSPVRTNWKALTPQWEKRSPRWKVKKVQTVAIPPSSRISAS